MKKNYIKPKLYNIFAQRGGIFRQDVSTRYN